MLKTPTVAAEGESKEKIRKTDEIVIPTTFEAIAQALKNKKNYSLEIMTDPRSAVSQQEILAAWIMGVPSIGDTLKDINPDILFANAHLGGDKRALADEVLNTLDTITNHGVSNAREIGVDVVIEEAELILQEKGFGSDSPEMQELGRLNAAKSMYKLLF